MPLELCTFCKSFLSARRATTSPIKYNPKRQHTVERTTKFPVSLSLLNSVQTLSKSMGFGATKMFPPNAERWVHKQCSSSSVCFHPTFKESNQFSLMSDCVVDFYSFAFYSLILGCVSLGKSNIGLLNWITTEQINQRSVGLSYINGTKELFHKVDSSVRLIHRDQRDLGSIF